MTSESGDKPSHKAEPSQQRRSKTGIARLFPALLHSVDGLVATVKTETAFRQELALFAVMLPAGIWLGQSSLERALLVIPLFLVLIAELLNTALENAIDRWGSDYNDFSKAAKDAGSAAVFVSIALVVVTWAILLLPVLLGSLGR